MAQKKRRDPNRWRGRRIGATIGERKTRRGVLSPVTKRRRRLRHWWGRREGDDVAVEEEKGRHRHKRKEGAMLPRESGWGAALDLWFFSRGRWIQHKTEGEGSVSRTTGGRCGEYHSALGSIFYSQF
jgi:hypothetical protein